jgi:Xaa-Pro aminopeptidase
VLVPGEEAARLTGIRDVRSRDAFEDAFRTAVGAGRVVLTPFRTESLAAGTPDSTARHTRAQAADPWDWHGSRESAFAERLKATAPGAQVQDLDPILDALRVIKTPREIAAIRASTELAGLAMTEAMRSAHPGMRENEIEAIGDYVFKSHGAQGIAYFGLVAAGANAVYPHYHGGTDVLQPGDLVLFDYAPDLNYYSSDVTRMFPASGRFSPAQRELYGVYVKLYLALTESVRPGIAPRDIRRAAIDRMDGILQATSFSAPRYRAAAQAFVDALRTTTRNSLGHFVGMEVHDVTTDIDVLEPGMAFTIEPALRVPEDGVYIRLEDVLVVTPSGHENLSARVPVDPDAIEHLMAQRGRFEAASGTTGATQ